MRPNWTGMAVAAITLAAALAACGGDGDADTAAADAGIDATTTADAVTTATTTFVGTVAGTDAYFAVTDNASGDDVAYLCDGQKIWTTYFGAVAGDTFTGATLEGAPITVTIDGDEATGSATLEDGTSHDLRGERATGDAGWFNLTTQLDDGVEVGNWIRLADGSVRGKSMVATSSETPQTGDGVTGTSTAGAAVPPEAVPTGAIKCIKAALARRKAYNALAAAGFPDDGPLDDAARFAHEEFMNACVSNI